MRQRPAGVRLARALTAAVAGVLLAAGCAVPGPERPIGPVSAPPMPIPTECVFALCGGQVGPSEYRILMPARWNGTLLLFTPGFSGVSSTPGTGKPIQLGPAPNKPMLQRLIARGYALAAGAYAYNGWSADQSMAAAELAYQQVKERFGTPRQVYAWGESMGGLTAVLMGERHPDWISGVASACGVVGGTERFFDLALDAQYAVKTLLAPGLSIGPFASYHQAAAAYSQAHQVIQAALHGTPQQRAALLLIGSVIGAPARADSAPGQPGSTQLEAAASTIDNAVSFGSQARWDLERRFGGRISDNTSVDYGARVDASRRATLDALAPGYADEALHQLGTGLRVRADAQARAAVARSLSPQGTATQPTVTMHTVDDAVVQVQHEGAYKAEVAQHGGSDRLVQLITVPPKTYTTPVPPYGVGHCRFTADELTGLLTVLDRWVTSGQKPDQQQVRNAFGKNNGIDYDYPIPAWPVTR